MSNSKKSATDGLTPMMRQYNEIKGQFKDCILFFRLGDFYEMFGEDAILASQILDITLTSRNKSEDALPMCGVPFHSAESYVAKLNQKGKKVAICEQVGDTKGPGIVERKVVRVFTPSTNLSDYCLEGAANQFTAGLIKGSDSYGLCFCDVSTGEILVSEFTNLRDCISAIAAHNAREVVIEKKLSEDPELYGLLANEIPEVATSTFEIKISEKQVYDFLCAMFSVKSLTAMGIEQNETLTLAVYLTVGYLESMLKVSLSNIQKIQLLKNPDFFELDRTTVNNLEIFYNSSDFGKKGSLISVLDCVQTAAAGRLLRQRLIKPLKNIDMLQKRLNLVEQSLTFASGVEEVRKLFKHTYDLERLISKTSLKICNPREILMIKQTLEQLPHIKNFYNQAGTDLKELSLKLNELNELKEYLDRAISDEAPLSRRDGGIFKEGFNEKVDELRKLLYQGKDYILELQKREIESTGIGNLKISFNKVFGYYIEVSKGKVDQVPDYFIRKQTLTNSERYITPELKEYEDKVLNAENELKILEDDLFDEVIDRVLGHKSELLLNAKVIAQLDLYASFAYLAYHNDYCKPVISNQKLLKIVNGRHPVVEKLVETGGYVPNDLEFSEQSYMKLITGPNMGGKSTYLRQTALIVLMTQIGCYVPAGSAEIGIVDQIYTRVGASDNISRGQSTFMVEMEETAYILRQASENSLLILDEIGRGTSTYDGVSLAWAILEYLHNEIKPRTLFATHYHELIELTQSLESADNLSVSVEDDGVSTPVFLHKIRAGAVDKSYGVHVATMAGIPKGVVNRANELLGDLEGKTVSRQHQPLVRYQESLFDNTDKKAIELKEKIAALDLNNLTPLEALQKLAEIKGSIE